MAGLTPAIYFTYAFHLRSFPESWNPATNPKSVALDPRLFRGMTAVFQEPPCLEKRRGCDDLCSAHSHG